jgi:hypothetical protein
MHKTRKSEVQLTGCSLQHFYSWNSTTTSFSCCRKNHNPQIHSMKDSPQNISRGLQIISIILIPWPQLRWIISRHSFWPDYQAQQSLSCPFSHFACPPSHEAYTSPDTFFLLAFFKERILCKWYAILWQKVENMFVEAVSSVSIHQIWFPSTSESEAQTLSSRILFPCIFVFLYQNREKLVLSLSEIMRKPRL